MRNQDFSQTANNPNKRKEAAAAQAATSERGEELQTELQGELYPRRTPWEHLQPLRHPSSPDPAGLPT